MASPKPVRPSPAIELSFEKGLPANPDAERLVLGAIMIDDSNWENVAASLEATDFSLEKHRRIFQRMRDLRDRSETIDRVTVANELVKQGQLESVDGLTYLVSLDRDLPDIANLESYVAIVKDKSNLRTLIFNSQKVIDRCLHGDEAAQVIAESAAQTFGKIDSSRSDEGSTPEEILSNFKGGVSVFLDPTLRTTGRPTGFKKLDELLGGGLQDGELTILAARPSCGKSALMSNICQNMVLDKVPNRVDIFSLEMSAASLVTRMMCAVARVDSHKFRCGYLNQEERRRLQVGLNAIVESPLRIHENFRKTLPEMMRRIRKAFKEGSALVAIDFVQLMVTGGKSENRNLEIGEIARALKLATLEADRPILLLSQIGRSSERRGGDFRPGLSDLKDSGTLEENADVVMTIFREELYKKDREDIKGLADLDVIKNRSGPIGRVPLRFLGQYVKFETAMDYDAEPDEPRKLYE